MSDIDKIKNQYELAKIYKELDSIAEKMGKLLLILYTKIEELKLNSIYSSTISEGVKTKIDQIETISKTVKTQMDAFANKDTTPEE